MAIAPKQVGKQETVSNIAASGAITLASKAENYRSILIDQSTAGVAATLPAPDDTSIQFFVLVSNIGTALINVENINIAVNESAGFVWTGAGYAPINFNGAKVFVADTAPTGASNGDLWFESDTFNFYCFYNDGVTGAWVNTTQVAASAARPTVTVGTFASRPATGKEADVHVVTSGANSGRAYIWDDVTAIWNLLSGVGRVDNTADTTATTNAVTRIDANNPLLIKQSLVQIDDLGNVTGVRDIAINGRSTQTNNAVGSAAINCANGNMFSLTVNSNVTFSFANAPAAGTVYMCTVIVTHNAGTLSFPASVYWPSGITPIFTPAKTHMLMFYTIDGGAKWRAAAQTDYTT